MLKSTRNIHANSCNVYLHMALLDLELLAIFLISFFVLMVVKMCAEYGLPEVRSEVNGACLSPFRWVKVKVYGLLCDAKCHSPDYSQLLPGHRTSSFIYKPSQLPGSTQPGCRFWRTVLSKHTEAFTVPPGATDLLLHGSGECTCMGKVSCLGAQPLSGNQPAGDPNPRSFACKSRTLRLNDDARQNWEMSGARQRPLDPNALLKNECLLGRPGERYLLQLLAYNYQ